MSYQVLARKWRPHNFKQVVGQQHVLTALVNALDQNRLHHAYLFSGTRGVGKTSIARILAKSLNCEKGVTSEPCGVCHHCQDIDQGRFVDLLEIDAASRTKVEDTRELLDNVQYKPAQGRYKVYLIDEVHMLSKSSFNALLKTLEEPPEYVKFLLATTDPQKLPITILSRCLQFHLKSLSSDDIQRQLAYILDQEQHSYENNALQALAKAAHGSMRDALSLTDQAIAFGNGVVNYQPVLAMLGTLDQQQVTQLLHFVAAGDAANCLAKVAELVTLGPDFDLVHNEIAATLHQVALAHMLPSTLTSLDNRDSIQLLTEQLSPEQVQLYYQIALKGKQDLPLAPEPRVGLEMTLMRMLAFHPMRVASTLPTSPVAAPAPIPVTSVSMPGNRALAPATELMSAAPIASAESPTFTSDVTASVDVALATPAAAIQTGQSVQQLTPSYELPLPELKVPSAQYQEAEIQAESVPEQYFAPTEISSPPPLPSVSNALETRNMLRSRKLALEAGKKSPVKPLSSPNKPIAAATTTAVNVNHNEAVNTSLNATPPPATVTSVLNQPTLVNQTLQQEISDVPAGFNDLPPLEAYDNDYSHYFQTDEYEPSFTNTAEPSAPANVTTPPVDLPWEAEGTFAVNTPAPAMPVKAAIPTQPAPTSQQEAAYTRALPELASAFSAQNDDPWCGLIEQMGLAGILRQLAINSVFIQTDSGIQLMLQPASQHLDNARNLGQITAALQSVLPQVNQVEIVIGRHPSLQTPVEIEQAIYLARLAQAKVDIKQDEAINFFIQRFGAIVDEESIKPV